MIIEFIGIPGAGKTTLQTTVVDYLNAQGYCAYSVVEAARPLTGRTMVGRAINRLAPPTWRRPLLWQAFYHFSRANRIRFYAQHAELMRLVWRFQRQRPLSSQDRLHVLHWFYHQTGVYEFLRHRVGPKDVVIFDEGFIHRVVQLFASENEWPDPAAVTAYIDLIPRPDLVIHPTAPSEVCERRVYARGLWERFQVKSADDTARFFISAERAVNLAVNVIKQRRWPVIDVDNSSENPNVAQAELWRALSERIPGAILPSYQPATV
jgi:thymidylate kinase